MSRLVIVSNRVSLPSGNGAIRAGGLEVALAPITGNGTPTLWFGWSGKIVEAESVSTRRVEQRNRAYVVTDLSWTMTNTTMVLRTECCGRFSTIVSI